MNARPQTAPQGDLLCVRNLFIEAHSNSAGWQPIVRDVSFSIRRGEVLGLIGESGAGKSTVGLASMGFLRPGCRISGGGIDFDGIDIRRAGLRQLQELRGRRIAYVAQSAAASFNPTFRIIDQCIEPAVSHRLMTAADARFEMTDLYRRMNLPDPDQIGLRYPHQVSGGQLQRAMTAMAIQCKPDLIVFDEPTTALDVTTQIGVLAAIRDIVRRFNTAGLYITHDLAVVAQMADRIKILLRGEEVEEADTKSIMTAPQSAYTRSLWAVRSLKRPERSPDPETEPLLSVENLSAKYGKHQALSGVSLHLRPARTTAIVGESGSGKSTLARVIAGLLPPSEGAVTFKGRRLAPSFRHRTPDQLRKIQIVFQSADNALNPSVKVRDLIARPLRKYHKLSGAALTARVRELLTQIELEPDVYMDKYPPQLSGGQKQRVNIARALAAGPDLLICDEVTSALDQLVAESVLSLLARLQGDLGIAYLFITHDLATVRAIADDVVVMRSGQVVEKGNRSEILERPSESYTQRLLASVPEMDTEWLDRVLGDAQRPNVSDG